MTRDSLSDSLLARRSIHASSLPRCFSPRVVPLCAHYSSIPKLVVVACAVFSLRPSHRGCDRGPATMRTTMTLQSEFSRVPIGIWPRYISHSRNDTRYQIPNQSLSSDINCCPFCWKWVILSLISLNY